MALEDYGSHQRLLLRAALRTCGPMLELGVGYYSTPLLHEIAVAQKRPLVTHDNDPAWVELFRPFAHAYHHVALLDRHDWENIHWGLVFVDHGPRPDQPRNSRGLLNALDRAQAVLDLMSHTDVFVLHDTQPDVRWEYDWDKILPLFKHVYTDTTYGPVSTTAVSNTIDVGGEV